MARIGDNFLFSSSQPNFARDTYNTHTEMRAVTLSQLDRGHIVFCKEDNKHYIFAIDSNNFDSELGYFTELSGGLKEVEYNTIDNLEPGLYTTTWESTTNPVLLLLLLAGEIKIQVVYGSISSGIVDSNFIKYRTKSNNTWSNWTILYKLAQPDWEESDSEDTAYIKNKPTIDSEPTENSTGIPQSGGTYTLIQSIQAAILQAISNWDSELDSATSAMESAMAQTIADVEDMEESMAAALNRLHYYAVTLDFGTNETSMSFINMDSVACTIKKIKLVNVSSADLTVVNGTTTTITTDSSSLDIEVPADGQVIVDITRSTTGKAYVGIKYELE